MNFIGKLTNGTSSGAIGDYQFSHKNDQISIGVHGGNYQDGDKAGLFRLHMGVKMYGQTDEMVLVDEFRDYTGNEIEQNYEINGELVENGEGKIFKFVLQKQLSDEEVLEIRKIEIQ